MTTTTSRVTYGDTKNNDLLREQCKAAAAQGGSYSITSEYVPGSCWFNVYVINWPEGTK